MKRTAILAGIVASALMSGAAYAADLAVAPAPPPAPVNNWTGFYLGVHGGAAWQSMPTWTLTDPNLILATTSVTSGSAQLGAVGGLQAGYNWQFAPAWVAGIEGDFSWASLADHRTNAPLLSPAGIVRAGNSVSMSANTEWLSSIRGKLGFAGWNTLWYVTGGGALANMEYAATSFVGPGGSLNSVTSFNTTKSGWVVGGGAEWMTTNILLRAEYLYYGINTAANGSAGVSPPSAVWPLPLNYSWSRDNVQVFRIAGSYKF